MTEMTGQEKGSDYQRQGQEKNVYHKSGIVPTCKTGFCQVGLRARVRKQRNSTTGVAGQKTKNKAQFKILVTLGKITV